MGLIKRLNRWGKSLREVAPTLSTSYGDLVDRLTILTIKGQRLTGTASVQSFAQGIEIAAALDDYLFFPIVTLPEYHDLLSTNQKLWDVEDDLRALLKTRNLWTPAERAEFIRLAIDVPRLNEVRSGLKKAVDIKLPSKWTEHKQYTEWLND